jgi:hypothetical protein
MSERIISISPYAKADNMIDLKGYVSIEGIEEKIEIPEKKHLILYNGLQLGEVADLEVLTFNLALMFI